MLVSWLWEGLLSLHGIARANQEALVVSDQNSLDVTYETWTVLGPFQIGTREAPWGADPLEYHGGFRNVAYSPNATFRSSIAINGTVGWSNHTAKVSHPDSNHGIVELSVGFPELEDDWKFLQSVYGWEALQWQGWARGDIIIHPESAGPFVLHAEGVLEFWIDDVHYFGGDSYGYGRAPVTLKPEPGVHRIDVRLVRDVRAMGAGGAPTVDVKLRLERSRGGLELLHGYGKNVLMSEVVGGTFGPLASPYASIMVCNDAETDIYVHGVEGMEEKCMFRLLSGKPIKLVPGQTRPITFEIECVPSYDKNLHLKIKYTIDGAPGARTLCTSTWPHVQNSFTEPHRVTFLHPGGMVSYAILRPPSETCGTSANASLPILLALHGAGLEADSPLVRHALDDLPDLCAWVLFPTGVTPWSGDDWHIWGWVDVEAAIAMIPDWIKQVEWQGPGVDTSRWLVAGHSNGGQGTWYALTHKFDKVVAAAPLSGYSSIENYVPYTFWRTADPGRVAVVHGATNSFRHELLLGNAKGIPVLQQHGGADDNVPVYHSRLMSQLIQEAGAHSDYVEMESKPHYWDGVMTTQPLRDFFTEHVRESTVFGPSPKLESFSIVVANPAETGLKFGVRILHTLDPGRLGRFELVYDQLSGSCSFHLTNILMWSMPQMFRECWPTSINGRAVTIDAQVNGETIWLHDGHSWQLHDSIDSATSGAPMRDQRQLGHMDAILRTKGAFTIVRHTLETTHITLQVSRNLCQYFAADTVIMDNYTSALQTSGNIISLATGPSISGPRLHEHAIEISDSEVVVHLDAPYAHIYEEIDEQGLGAIFIRPLPEGRLELVVWGKDDKSLDVAARLVPMMTGSGQPDFVVVDRKMLWKGVEGARAMGFFDAWWNVTRSSFLG